MRANKPPRRKPTRGPSSLIYPQRRDSLSRWNLRFLLGTVVFGAGTLIAILLLTRYAGRMPFDRARMAVYGIFAMFIVCELCAAGALVTWWYRRKRR